MNKGMMSAAMPGVEMLNNARTPTSSGETQYPLVPRGNTTMGKVDMDGDNDNNANFGQPAGSPMERLGKQAARAKTAHGYAQDDDQGLRSAGGPHHPDAGVLEEPRMVPNGAMPKNATKADKLDKLADQYGYTQPGPWLEQNAIDEASASDRENAFEETAR